MKRVMTIQDISCIGKCSLTAAIPVISAFGVETAVVPTAILSTHTQFDGFTFRDLSDDLPAIMEHWKKENFKFDAIYTGYLASKKQIDIVSRFFDTFKTENNFILVDPAMADNGKLYTGFPDDFAKSMADLCGKADVILPNISEAFLLLNKPYPGENADPSIIRSILPKLTDLGAKTAVVTGVSLDEGKLGYIGYNRETRAYFEYATEKINWRSHGTGDIFASAFCGAAVTGFSVPSSLEIAADFTCACIKNTYNDPDRVDYAVNLEAELPNLIHLIDEKRKEHAFS